MLVFNAVLFASAIFFKCNAKFVDTLEKCSIKDDECMRLFYQSSTRKIGKDGIPEANILPIDPFHLNNITLNVLDAVKATLYDGVVKGISKCEFHTFHVDLEKQTAKQEFTCDLRIKGSTSFDGTSPTLQALIGTAKVEGHAKGSVKLEKVNIQLVFPFYPFKKEDGEIHFKVLNKDVKYKYDIKNAVMSAEKIYLGKNEISQLVVPYFNTNWKTLLKTYGQVIVDKALEFYFNFAQTFFEGIPCKYFIIEDLTPYIKN